MKREERERERKRERKREKERREREKRKRETDDDDDDDDDDEALWSERPHAKDWERACAQEHETRDGAKRAGKFLSSPEREREKRERERTEGGTKTIRDVILILCFHFLSFFPFLPAKTFSHSERLSPQAR